jgi:hypothetical protein
MNRAFRVPVLYLDPGFHAVHAFQTSQFIGIFSGSRMVGMFKSSLPHHSHQQVTPTSRSLMGLSAGVVMGLLMGL